MGHVGALVSGAASNSSGRPAAGMLYGLAAFTLFACGDAAFKWLSDGQSVFQAIMTAFLIAFVLVAARAQWQGGLRSLVPRYPGLVLLRSVLLTGAVSSFIWAISRMPLADGYAIVFSVPVLVAVLSVPLLGERVDRGGWIAVLVGFCGVMIMLRPGFATLEAAHLAALASATMFAAGTIVMRRIPTDESELAPVAGVLVTTVLVTAPIAAQDLRMPMAGDWAIVILAGVVNALGHLCLVRGLREAAAALVAPFQYTQIVWAVIFGALIFGDRPDLVLAIGVVPVIGSGLYLLLTHGRERRLCGADAPP